MLGRMFISLCRFAPLRKLLWRGWYGYLASMYRVADWTFMNYGYAKASSREPLLQLSPADEPDRFSIQLYHHVVSAVDLKHREVLEVGSGRGGGASFIKRYLQPARMVGVDLSENAVNLSRTIHVVDGLEFFKGDAEHLPFAPESFNAVVNVESSHCYASFDTFLSEVRRVLRKDGYFLYADFRENSAVDRWRRAMETSRLTVLRERNITPYVLEALNADDDRKRALIRKVIPRFLTRPFLDFAAVRGSSLYEAFRSGKLVYMSFVLQKRS